jgi:hypothetical protein
MKSVQTFKNSHSNKTLYFLSFGGTAITAIRQTVKNILPLPQIMQKWKVRIWKMQCKLIKCCVRNIHTWSVLMFNYCLWVHSIPKQHLLPSADYKVVCRRPWNHVLTPSPSGLYWNWLLEGLLWHIGWPMTHNNKFCDMCDTCYKCDTRNIHRLRKREDWTRKFRSVILRPIWAHFTTMTVVHFPST